MKEVSVSTATVAAIRQDGTNQVNLITSAADRQAAVEFARAAATRPALVGAALQGIMEADRDVATCMFEILETQRVLESDEDVMLVPGPAGMVARWYVPL